MFLFNEFVRRVDTPSPDSRLQQYTDFPGLLIVDSIIAIRDLSAFKNYMLHFYLTSALLPHIKHAKLKTLFDSDDRNRAPKYLLDKLEDCKWRKNFLSLYKEFNTSLLFTSKEYDLLCTILTILQ